VLVVEKDLCITSCYTLRGTLAKTVVFIDLDIFELHHATLYGADVFIAAAVQWGFADAPAVG
jgi:hypothetical protein